MLFKTPGPETIRMGCQEIDKRLAAPDDDIIDAMFWADFIREITADGTEPDYVDPGRWPPPDDEIADPGPYGWAERLTDTAGRKRG